MPGAEEQPIPASFEPSELFKLCSAISHVFAPTPRETLEDWLERTRRQMSLLERDEIEILEQIALRDKLKALLPTEDHPFA